MTIQSDVQIEQLCTPPKVTFDKWNYDNDIKVANQAGTIPMEEPAHSEWFEALRKRWSYPTPADLAWKPMISPFVSTPTRTVKSREVRGGEICFDERKVISFGLTSYGYDVRLAEEFKIFTNVNSVSIDPKCLDEKCLVTADIHEDPDGSLFVWLPPNSYMLGRTVEYFVIPRDIFIVCLGKSTYARAGAIVNVTPIEPGFEGNVVIEISNSTNLPLKVYANEGISQFVFLKGDQPCRLSYADKGGKYQFQQGITLPRA